MPRTYACDRCKRRKVRCNGADPCAQCSRCNSPCERRTITRRPGPRVARRALDADDRPTELGYVASPQQSMTHGDALSSVILSDLVPEEQQDNGNDIVATDDCSVDTSERYERPLAAPLSHSPSLSHSTGFCDVTAESVVWREFRLARTQLITRFHASQGVSGNIEEVAHGCVDLFTQFLFPNTPIAHEPTLRACIPLLSPNTAPSPASFDDEAASIPQPIPSARRFTLITALCAHILSVVPESLSRRHKSLSVVFFDASRSMLRAYEAYDLEHPDSTSLTIRMWHSSCAQNTTGKVGASWHYHTEACCLAQRLRLFDESSISRPSVLESRLLRANFWHLYLAEKTQVAFRTRPPIIDERICYGGITLLEESNEIVPFLDPCRRQNGANLESRIFVGFHLRRRISAIAAGLIDDIASCATSIEGKDPPRQLNVQDQEVSALIERYLDFAALVNEVPPWVMHPDRYKNSQVEDDGVRAYQAICFWAQRNNIMTIFHCMRLLILQACIDHNLTVVVGLSGSPLSWASRKLEIIRDFVHDLEATPFVCLEAQGETTVDKVRRVGAMLLELLRESSNATIKTQADTIFKSLLDILSRLDSKACEGL